MPLIRIRRDGTFISHLEPRLESLLGEWWTGTIGGNDHDAVAKVLSEMRDLHEWLACSCVGNQGSKPIMVPVMVDETMFLRRLVSRAGHSQGCIFQFDKVDAPSTEKSDADGGGVFGPPPAFVESSRAVSLSNERMQHRASDISLEKNVTPAIARRFFWLAQEAGWQQWPKRLNPVTAVLARADAIPVHTSLTLKDILFCNERVWTQSWADGAFKKCRKIDLKPVCYWIKLIDGFDVNDRTFTFVDESGKRNHVGVDGRMAVHGGDTSDARFPMLLMAKLSLLDTRATVVSDCYAHPIASPDHWMLVDSNLERQTLNDLIRICEELRQASGIQITLQKPLHLWGETGERPDFVLSIGHQVPRQQLVVETMGYEDPTYELRKLNLTRRVPCQVHLDLRHGSQTDATSTLRAVVRDWFERVNKL